MKCHEIELHRKFKTYRHRGEWFRYEGKLADYIEDVYDAELSVVNGY